MTSNFIEKHKKIYMKLSSCKCQALQKTVYFNADGLNHILYYRRRPRSHNEKHYRAGLIPYITEVISSARHAIQEVYPDRMPVIARFWKKRAATISH